MMINVQNILLTYLKILSIGIFMGLIVHVAAILDRSQYLGIYSAASFSQLPLAWQIGHFYFAILDSLAAVSLWKGESWGVVLWLFIVANQLVMYLALAHIFGEQPELVMIHLVTVAIYVALRLAEGLLSVHSAQRGPAEGSNALD